MKTLKYFRVAALLAMIFFAKQAIYSEGTATLVKSITPKPGVMINSIIPAPNNRGGIFIGSDDGSADEFNNDLVRIGEVARVQSGVTSLALMRDGRDLAIGTEHHAMWRYRRSSYSSRIYDTNPLRLGQTVYPVTNLCFDPSGSYLIPIDIQGSPSIYINEDKQNSGSSGNGNLINMLRLRGVRGVLPFGDSIIFLQPGKIAAYEFEWNIPSTDNQNSPQPVSSQKGPQFKQETERVLVEESAVHASLSPSQNILYFIKEEGILWNIYKFNIRTNQKTLFYTSTLPINDITATDDEFNVFIAVQDSVLLLRDEHVAINVNNNTGISFTLNVNGITQTVASQSKAELIRKPGNFRINAYSASANLYFENYDSDTIRVDLANLNELNITALRRFPLSLAPVRENLISPNECAMNYNNTLQAIGVSHNRNYFLSVLDAQTHRQLYRINISNTNRIPFLFSNNAFFAADRNIAYRYEARTGVLEAEYEMAEDIIFMDASSGKLLVLSSNFTKIIEINTGKQWLLTAEDDAFDTAKFLSENEFVVSRRRNFEKYRIDQEQLTLMHRIPRSWLGSGNTKSIIPAGSGGFSVLLDNNMLQAFTEDPNIVEPVISHQFNAALEFQFYYLKNGVSYIRFLNKTSSRLEDYDCALPDQIYNTVSVDRNLLSVCGSQDTTFLAITNEAVMVYANNTITGRYYFFNDAAGVFLAPAVNQRSNDRFFGISDDFDPTKHLRIRQQNSPERDFSAEDAESTEGK